MSLSETSNKKDPIRLPKSISYLSQNPLIFGISIKENILLNLPEDKKRLAWAIKSAAFDSDVKLLKDKLETMVGEQGTTLSGGQKIRLALARNLYRDSSLYILDDPLSALDLKVGSFIMENTILNELAFKTRIIITHAIQYTKHADRIIMMDNGKIVIDGDYESIKESELFKELENSFNDFNIKTDDDEHTEKMSPLRSPTKFRKQSTLIEEAEETELEDGVLKNLFFQEDREVGNVSWSIFNNTIKNIGGWFMFSAIFLITLIFVAINIWINNYLLNWSEDLYCTDRWDKMVLWTCVIFARCILVGVRFFVVFRIGFNFANKIHAKMAYQVLHSRVHEFLDKVPIGRIMNRFSKDIDIIDLQLFVNLSTIFMMVSTVLGDLFVVVSQTS